MERTATWFAAALIGFAGAADVAAAAGNPRETPVVLAVRKASPAVVNISAETVTRAGRPFRGMNPFFDDFFRDFFGDMPETERRQRSLGSGVVIRADGLVLTNEHVVQNASRILVTRASGEEYEAQLVGADSRTDLAVLRVEAPDSLPFLAMGTSEDLMIGETVIAIGNPFGLSHTVTTGVVSALNRTIRGANDRVYTDFIQTDASINPGNSGGPLLNIGGDLVGVNSAIYQRAEGIGFAIPIDKAKRIVDNLIAYGKVHRAWLGIHVQDMTPELARHFGVPPKGGVLVTRVFEDSPGAEAGLERGDVVVALGSGTVRDRDDFFERLAGYTAGSKLVLRVLHDGKEVSVGAVAREIPAAYVESLSESWLGLSVAESQGRRSGVLVAGVRRGSAAADSGIEAGDLVRQVNSVPVGTVAAYREALLQASQRETVVLVVQRGRVGYYVSLSP